jgi:hypothetical protein
MPKYKNSGLDDS